MKAAANGNGAGVAGLAARLTDPKDRETYTKVVSYVQALPPGDEFKQLVDMLGLLSLLGQRIPEAVTDLLKELRAENAVSAAYHEALEARVAGLPEQIASGVDAEEIARAVGERFRQQIAATGLQEATTLLFASANHIKALSGEIASALKPAPEQYRSIGATIASDLASLRTASNQVRQHLADMAAREQQYSALCKAVVIGAVFVVGIFCGWYAHDQAPDCPALSALVQPAPTPN